jgi:hypothetical protein
VGEGLAGAQDPAAWLKPVKWPDGRQFAFTIFDDPDGQSLETSRLVYGLLTDLGFRTTVAVWPSAAHRDPNSGGETCANPAYLDHLRSLEASGFEIGWHNASPQTSTREETIDGMNGFRQFFGHDPESMANHYNGEALYWGAARLGGARRALYLLLTRYATANRHFGHIEGHPYFWGDLCRDRIRYCRNFIFSDLNTLRACPWMPYYDPERPWVNRWFAGSEGAQGPAFRKMVSEANQDLLEEQGGAGVVYTHFGHGFVENGRLNRTFVQLMERLRRKNGWFVPTRTLLDYLAIQRGIFVLDDRARRSLEWRWLAEKVFRGTS